MVAFLYLGMKNKQHI